MAKTREQWEDEVADEAVLEGLSTSGEAEYLGLRDMVITLVMAFVAIVELLYKQIDDTIRKNRAGLYEWYPDMIKAFQHGDNLVSVDGVLGYEVVDESKQIITQVGMKKSGGQLNIKVAKDDVDGEPVQLSLAERQALAVYLDARVPPGVDFAATSLPADVVKYILTLKFDTKYDKAALLDAVDEALTDFRKNFSFNSIFYKSELITKIRSVPGVLSVVPQISMTLNNGTETVNALEEERELPAGYFKWDETSTVNATAISTT